MSKEDLMFHPIISSIQRIALYETKARFYLIGSNNTQTRFRVLKIDRTDPKELLLVDDKVEYNKQEIHQLLNMIGFGNRGGKTSGFNKLVSAFGIVGFIRFLEGYYIVLVTKRRKIAVIGAHSLYKVEDTATIYIPSDAARPHHPDEQRYLKMFMAIDLSTNFYYSYSYDITHTLQMNMAPPRQLAPAVYPQPPAGRPDLPCRCRPADDDEDIFETWKQQIQQRQGQSGMTRPRLEFGVRAAPHWRFVWNSHLVGGVLARLHADWILYVTHGFVEQGNLNIFGRPVYLTIIARRSNRYAGTRFLKRGASARGDVANEVETEQIVHDAMLTSFSAGRFSSFVQMRGSIPSFWSQDVSKMVPKPAIAINLSDPFAQLPARHINNLMRRYGAPVIFLNLVKKREKRRHESLLTDVIGNAVKYLNQFLPPEFAIEYYHFDMARKNKGTKANVLDKLSDIAQTVVRRTGIFLNCRGYDGVDGVPGHQGGRVQTGLVRVNCVDCLDRTNTAQFAIGKCVLAHQLYALGLISSPVLEFDSDCVRLLEGLYEDHGDTLALQYGGSQLVHRIKTYRKTAPWSSHGNDIMQTLSRYYSNTFSDAEKQNTMNLFLGHFVPRAGSAPVWDYPTDYTLHHPEARCYVPSYRSLTQWWDDDVFSHLPRAAAEVRKRCCEVVGVSRDRGALEMVDAYLDHHRPDTYTVLADTRELKMCHTLRDLAPQFTQNYSPFVVRGGSKRGLARARTAGNNSSDSDNSCSSDDSLPPPRAPPSALARARALLATPTAAERDDSSFLPVRASERVVVPAPQRRDLIIYKRYVNFARASCPAPAPAASPSRSPAASPSPSRPPAPLPSAPALTVTSALRIDSSAEVIPPTVPRAARDLYRRHAALSRGPERVGASDVELYRRYVAFCR